MLLTKEVETSWNPTTRKHYETLGYKFTKFREKFIVKVEDLFPKSNIKIELECDYCNKKIPRSYNEYNDRKSELLNKDACKKCTQAKTTELNIIKQNLGLLTKEDKGYWNFKQNRQNELRLFIDNNGTIDHLAEKDRTLYDAIWKYDGSVNKLLSEMNINWNEVCSVNFNNHYKNFENVKTEINSFINTYKRFPHKKEIIKELGIQQRDIDYHGGIYELKRKLNYLDDKDLVDDNGFLNGSRLEYLVAQYLIHNEIPYKREQRPFPKNEGYYRSDFCIESVDGKVFHVELWGFRENDVSGIGKRYGEIKQRKLKLYQKYNLNLISLNYSDMYHKNLDGIQNYLINSLSVLKGYNFKIIENEFLVTPSQLTDEGILNEIMKYSEDEDYLPTQLILSELGLNHFSIEIRRRHKTYLAFAKKFNKKLVARSYEWNEELIFSKLFEIVSDRQLPINKKVLKELGLQGLASSLRKLTGSQSLIPVKLNFYIKYLKNNHFIHNEDVAYLQNIKLNKGINIMNVVTPDQQELAKQILDKYEQLNSQAI
ncbi:hypothetical protein P4V41_07140 [Fictibacillus nanhaiensis]|uniref:hypothetical protein n=1 Tax=Fictibacillus nanhaiensis TaxID=742169 RepID=UPI002E1DBE4E|nr:hypothetical protein [Fictibacillus nanhaiensis]